MSIIHERMPPDTQEKRHYHSQTRQFFFIFQGTLTMGLNGVQHALTPQSGIEIPPGDAHQARNDSDSDVEFLVISHPTARGDRTALS